jgi:RNA polymerase sigma factor (sigma-70 family)
MIRDEVVLVEILEQAGEQIVDREEREGRVQRLYGFAWVTVRNVAISKLRRSPYLLEQPTAGSAKSAAALSRLTSEHSSPASIEYKVLLSEVLERLSNRERMIAILKKSGFSSREIADHLGMSVSSVDTTFCRIRQKVQKLLRSRSELE